MNKRSTISNKKIHAAPIVSVGFNPSLEGTETVAAPSNGFRARSMSLLGAGGALTGQLVQVRKTNVADRLGCFTVV